MNDQIEPRATNFIGIYILSISLAIIIIILFFINNLNCLLYEPLITPEEWCQAEPCFNMAWFGGTLTINVPTSTIFVYGLGIFTIIIGIYFLKRNKEQVSLEWWGVSMIFWGLGALFAGTSYQLFSYELKCAGRQYCLWTSWWEISYLLLTAGAVDAMLMAQSYSCASGKGRKWIQVYAMLNSIAYIIIVVVGTLIPIRFLISFELLVLFLLPTTLFFFTLNIYRYVKEQNLMDRSLILTWVFLGIVIIVYYAYYLVGITERLWSQGIWFSANDVLHITLIAWMAWIAVIVPKHVRDQIND